MHPPERRACCADARDCVFFMHGMLDTSMGWVSNGVTGSQAFAAYDQGFDVWLGNSRSNPPRVHIGTCHLPHNATHSSMEYFPFSHDDVFRVMASCLENRWSGGHCYR